MRRKAPIDGWAVLMLVGVPVVLVRLVGWPWPNRLPSRTDVANWVAEPLIDSSITPTVVALFWLTWLILLAVAVVELCRWFARRRRLPRLQVPQPAQVLTATLMGTAAVSTSAGAVITDTGGPAVTLDDNRLVETSPQKATTTVQRAPLTVHVGATSYHYVVKPGDTLSKISRQWLGSANRWPEICRLNKHRHFPGVGGTLKDCDLIYPGWDLRLPADATPPAQATPTRPSRRAAPKPDRTVPVDPDGVVEPQPAPTSTPSPETAAESTSPPAPEDGEAPARSSGDQDGVRLPDGSFVPWTLAAAISAAAAMVWLQRRRRYTPITADDTGGELSALPAPVEELHRQVTRNPDLPTPTGPAERAAAVPALPQLPAGGIGLVGEGAPAAARAALVAALASGGPADPDRRGEVVTDTATLRTLCGPGVDGLGSWPRLHVADDFDDALSILDARLLHRARVLDEHRLTDLDSLRETAPDEEALPPVLLITATPPAGAGMRARVSFGLGNGLDVSALLLGQWPHGSTINVTADGHTHLVDGPHVDAFGERVAVLGVEETTAILTTLREAHTGEPPIPALRAPTLPQPAVLANEPNTIAADTSEPAPPDVTEPQDHALDEPPQAVDGKPRVKVRLRVLGTPTVENVTLPGRDLRGRAAELAVFLACHPDGADTETIAENLVPEFRRRQAKQQVHTNASNLRHVFGRAGGPITGGYVLKRGANARYRLDPTTVQVDLWQVRDLLTRAQLAPAPLRTELLCQACDLYTAPLAEGCDYEWVESHRETARRWGTEAHLLLADDLIESDPQAASDVLDKAIGLDRYNEQLYRKAMHARHALRDADSIRALLRALTKALADLDTEPAQATVELAAQLRSSVEQR